LRKLAVTNGYNFSFERNFFGASLFEQLESVKHEAFGQGVGCSARGASEPSGASWSGYALGRSTSLLGLAAAAAIAGLLARAWNRSLRSWKASLALALIALAAFALLPRFPYAMIFMDLGTEIRVLAVAHAKRRPGYWLDRVEERSGQ